MRQQQLIEIIAKSAGLATQQADDVLACIIEQLCLALSRGERVNLPGFGSFERRLRQERNGRNPQTGSHMIIPAHHQVVFKPGKACKSAVN